MKNSLNILPPKFDKLSFETAISENGIAVLFCTCCKMLEVFNRDHPFKSCQFPIIGRHVILLLFIYPIDDKSCPFLYLFPDWMFPNQFIEG